MTIAELIKFLFFQDGCFNNIELAVIYKNLYSDFMSIKSKNWNKNHLLVENEAGTKISSDTLPNKFHEEQYENKKARKSLSYNIHPFLANIIDDYISKSHYKNISIFIKSKMLEYNVLPDGLKNIILKSQNNNITKKPRGKNSGKTMSFTISAYESELYSNFIKYASSISHSAVNPIRLIKYALINEDIIEDMDNFPLAKWRKEFSNIVNGDFNPSKNYETNNIEDRSNLKKEVEKYKSYNSEIISYTLTFNKADTERLKSYIDELNSNKDNEVCKSMITSGRSKQVYLSDLVRHLIFEKLLHIYPNENIKKICFNPLLYIL